MRTYLRPLFLAIVLLAALASLGPWPGNLLYALRLTMMPAPATIAMPIASLRPQALRDTWHAARGAGRKHEGIDIFAKSGTPIHSATEGLVLGVGTNRLGGQVVWVLGPGGQRHYYAHLSSFGDVHPGMRVEAGDVLGYVGNTGNAISTPPHLHYGIYAIGGAINPYPILAQGGVQRTVSFRTDKG